MKHRGSQRLFDRPAVHDDAVVKCSMGKPDFPRPLSNGLSSTVMGDMTIIVPIIRLILRRSPAAVFRGVRPIIINTIQGAPVGARSHVGQKIIERVPAGVDSNPSSPVSGPGFPDPLAHRKPGNPRWASRAPVSFSSEISFSGIPVQAPTRPSVPTHQIPGRNFTLFPALTSTKPVANRGAVSTLRRGSSKCCKPTEHLSGQVFSVMCASSHAARVSENRRWSFWPSD